MNTLETAQRLIKAAGGIATGIGVGIAEPGYGTNETVWVTGNWNSKRNGTALSRDGDRSERLAASLERLGCVLLWLDVWTSCRLCARAVRTQPDSFFWSPFYVEDSSGITCVDCVLKDESTIREFVDNPTRCLPQAISEKQLTDWGWRRFNRVYHNGLREGMDDSPAVIFDGLKTIENPSYSVLFRLHGASQSYLEFTAWTREVS